MFEYIGMLIGLALYNGIAVPVAFPKALYGHIRNDKSLGIDDFWPTQSKSLQQISADNVEDMGLDYSMSFEANGLRVTISLPPGLDDNVSLSSSEREIRAMPTEMSRITQEGDCQPDEFVSENVDWPGWHIALGTAAKMRSVTEENKSSYVEDYIRCLVEESVKPQLTAFKRGFFKVIKPWQISFLRAEHLQQILEGTTELDIESLEEHTQYEGYTADDAYIKLFWNLVRSWSDERRKALVRFVTSASRMPVGSLSQLTFQIHYVSHNPDSPRLPTSSTCFGILYLPRYNTMAEMERALNTALDLGEYGFGIS